MNIYNYDCKELKDLYREVFGMFDLVDDYIEVFCGGRCLEFFYI